MTPALLARLNAAVQTIESRFGHPLRAPIAAPIDATNTLIVQPAAPLILEQGQVKLVLTQTGPDAVKWVIEVRALAADALAWCDAVDAGTTAALSHSSDVLLYENGQLSLGVGPGYVGDASGRLYYGTKVAGPYAITPAARAALTTAIRAML